MGGKERQLLEYSKYLINLGMDIMVLSISNKGIMPFELEQNNISFEVLSRDNSSVFCLMMRIWQLFRKRNVRVVYSFDSLAHLFSVPAALFSGSKLINGSIRDAGVNKGYSFLQTLIGLKLSHAVVANSYAGLNYYGIKNGGLVLYNAVDRTRFRYSHGDKNSIVMVANFTRYKNQCCLVDAAILLLERGYQLNVGFIGSGENHDFTQEYVLKSNYADKFKFHGYSREIEKMITSYGIGVLSSSIRYGEGVSNSILEYMGAGLVTIASNVGATTEIISDEVNGFLFEAANSVDLAEKIKRVIDTWEVMDAIREHAYRTLDEKFNALHNAKELIRIVNSMV